MLTPDGLFFAPGVRFRDLDFNDASALADALATRAYDWFLGPAERIAEFSPFASGVVVVCFIDAAAEFERIEKVQWLREAVPSSVEGDPRRDKKSIADSFMDDVRNGLVHHIRLNRGAEFSLSLEQPMEVINSVLIVNPLALLKAVDIRWQVFLDRIRSDPKFHWTVAEHVHHVFRVDFQADRNWPELES